MSVRELQNTEGLSVEDLASENPNVDAEVVEEVRAMLRSLRLAGITPQTYQITSSYETARQSKEA